MNSLTNAFLTCIKIWSWATKALIFKTECSVQLNSQFTQFTQFALILDKLLSILLALYLISPPFSLFLLEKATLLSWKKLHVPLAIDHMFSLPGGKKQAVPSNLFQFIYMDYHCIIYNKPNCDLLCAKTTYLIAVFGGCWKDPLLTYYFAWLISPLVLEQI